MIKQNNKGMDEEIKVGSNVIVYSKSGKVIKGKVKNYSDDKICIFDASPVGEEYPMFEMTIESIYISKIEFENKIKEDEIHETRNNVDQQNEKEKNLIHFSSKEEDLLEVNNNDNLNFLESSKNIETESLLEADKCDNKKSHESPQIVESENKKIINEKKTLCTLKRYRIIFRRYLWTCVLKSINMLTKRYRMIRSIFRKEKKYKLDDKSTSTEKL